MEAKQSAQQNNRENFQCRLYWFMTKRCNFSCPYCFREYASEETKTKDFDCGSYSPEQIAGRFDETGKVWKIYMTGGEPMLYPNFVSLAGLLTRGHYISLSTNLSTANAYEFADTVAGNRVISVRANIHVLEREKIKDGINEYLRKFHYFQDRGFDIRLVYVAYPPLLERMERDIEFFRKEGVRQIEVKVFQGKFEGRRFPREYSRQERDFLIKLGLGNDERQVLDSRVSFLGKKCSAGYMGFSMDPSGRITRCNTLDEEYENLFEGTFRPGSSPRRCPAKKCVCLYQGNALANTAGVGVPHRIIAQPVKFSIAFAESVCRLRK
ncbi:MAG: radical SAM protein [Sedimentisphaerales bacterium]|jgi:MoaA/NifB/PqqE/SkfB family radical SAM enzyme